MRMGRVSLNSFPFISPVPRPPRDYARVPRAGRHTRPVINSPLNLLCPPRFSPFFLFTNDFSPGTFTKFASSEKPARKLAASVLLSPAFPTRRPWPLFQFFSVRPAFSLSTSENADRLFLARRIGWTRRYIGSSGNVLSILKS